MLMVICEIMQPMKEAIFILSKILPLKFITGTSRKTITSEFLCLGVKTLQGLLDEINITLRIETIPELPQNTEFLVNLRMYESKW